MSLTGPFPDKSSLISSLATIQWPHSHHSLLKNTPPQKKSCVEQKVSLQNCFASGGGLG